jgi:DNA-binding NarL/FixJ family response regulator
MELQCITTRGREFIFGRRPWSRKSKARILHGVFPMNAAIEQCLIGVSESRPEPEIQLAASPSSPLAEAQVLAESGSAGAAGERVCVYVAAENRLLREALARVLSKRGGMEVLGAESATPISTDTLLDEGVDVLLLVSRGNLESDLAAIQDVHSKCPALRILLIATSREQGDFLQYVRAGISGFLWREMSGSDVLAAIRAVQRGEAVCPGSLCTALFHYFERESSALPCAGVQQRLGFTRREQQLIPLIAKGLTNKEIANHFYLSEQTVKNHLYRMKHKIGAEDRLSIVQKYRTQGFLL